MYCSYPANSISQITTTVTRRERERNIKSLSKVERGKHKPLCGWRRKQREGNKQHVEPFFTNNNNNVYAERECVKLG